LELQLRAWWRSYRPRSVVAFGPLKPKESKHDKKEIQDLQTVVL